jgi:hypothetical protein
VDFLALIAFQVLGNKKRIALSISWYLVGLYISQGTETVKEAHATTIPTSSLVSQRKNYAALKSQILSGRE